MTSIKKQEIYRPAVRRKPNLEVTGEEKPKTHRRRRKPNKRPFREKKTSLRPLRRKKPVCLFPGEENPVCAVPGRKISTDDISREKKNTILLAKILLRIRIDK